MTNGRHAAQVLLNDHTIYEHILDDRIFMGVMGILECERPQLDIADRSAYPLPLPLP